MPSIIKELTKEEAKELIKEDWGDSTPFSDSINDYIDALEDGSLDEN